MRTFVLLTFSATYVVCFPAEMYSQEKASGKTFPDTRALSPDDEMMLRNAVYGEGPKSTFADRGEWKGFEILLVPKKVNAVYAKDRKATLAILLKIVEGARPSDAMLAAGYAISLVDSPVAGYRFTLRKDAEYDRLDKGALGTSRQFAVNAIRKAIEQIDNRDPMK